MKILLVRPPGGFIHGPDYILASLYPRLPDYSFYLTVEILRKNRIYFEIASEQAENVKTERFDCAFFHLTLQNRHWAYATARRIRTENPGIIMIGAGIHVTLFSGEALSVAGFDYCIRGEFEDSLIQLIEILKDKRGGREKINGISFKTGEEILGNGPPALLSEKSLERLPFPAYDLVPRGVFSHFTLETSRGYPWYDPLNSTRNRVPWRAISPTGMMEKIQKIRNFQDYFTCHGTVILDDIFTTGPKRIRDYVRLMEQNRKAIPANLIYRARFSDILDKFSLNRLKGITARMILGPVCGYSRGQNLINRGIDIPTLKRTAESIYSSGMAEQALILFALNLPGEDLHENEKNLKLSSEIQDKLGITTEFFDFAQIPRGLSEI